MFDLVSDVQQVLPKYLAMNKEKSNEQKDGIL